MNFCSHCGSPKLEFKIPPGDSYQRYVCMQCSTIHYNNPKIIVGCLVVKGDEVLLAKRNIEPQAGLWNLPCGFLELGESLEDGAIRETLEETKARVQIDALYSVYSLLGHGQVYFHFLARMLNSDFGTTPESSEVAFFNKKNLPWDKLAFSSTRFSLEHFFDGRIGALPHYGHHPKEAQGY